MRINHLLSVSALSLIATASIGMQGALADTIETVQTSPIGGIETTRTTTTMTDTAPTVIRETPVVVTPPANNETVIVKEKKHHHLLNVGVPLLFHTSIF